MKVLTAIIVTAVWLMTAAAGQQLERNEQAVRFVPLHVYIDSGDRGLAAFQFELNATRGMVKIVGVEGGEHAAFAEPPYYDPAALANDRIIIGAFSTGADLPTGRTKIVTIHLQIVGEMEPEYELGLSVAGDSEGKQIKASISYEQGESK